MTKNSIPTLDLNDFLSGKRSRRRAFIDALGKSLEDLGFVAIINHGIPQELLSKGHDAAERTFQLSEEIKKKYAHAEIHHERGYTPFGVEHAKGSKIPDLKEFWHIGRVLPSAHPASMSGDIPPNYFPNEVSSFAVAFSNLFDQLEELALHLLDAVGAYLDQPPSFFREMVRDGNSVLRIINYPDQGEVPEGAVRAAAHEDINLLTVLPAASRPGLELLTREGEWMPITTPPNVMICDTGDMMALVTGGQLQATTHRVVNPPGGQDGGRVSTPFFLHPRSDYVLTPLRPYSQGAMPTRDFLFQRLQEIGVA